MSLLTKQHTLIHLSVLPTPECTPIYSVLLDLFTAEGFADVFVSHVHFSLVTEKITCRDS